MNLTIKHASGNTEPAPAKSGVGIGVLKLKSAKALIGLRFFYACFLVGVMGALSSARFLLSRNANPVAPATLLIGVNGGGFLQSRGLNHV